MNAARKSGLTWADLFQFGNVAWIIISVCHLRIQKVLEDFGMEADTRTKKAGTEGHWYLVDPEEIKKITQIESKIRRSLMGYSVPFPLVPDGKFLPDNNFEPFMNLMNGLTNEFRLAVDSLVARYDDLRIVQEPLIVAQIRKVVGDENFDCTYALDRLRQAAPKGEILASKYRISPTIQRFDMPINEQVASKLESEGTKVAEAVDALVEGAINPLKDRVAELLILVNKNNKKSFNEGTIRVGLRQCDEFDRKNVFSDLVLKQSISQLRSLLEMISVDIKNDDTEEFKLGLTKLNANLSQQDTKKVSARVTKKLGARKIL